MLSKKNYIIVGLTTFNPEFLKISVPAVAKLQQKVFLIIHNDNPKVKISVKQIRNFGYRGALHIINANENFGLLESRLNILSTIRSLEINSQWMVFIDDDDILTDVDVPDVSENNFAIIQDCIVIKHRLLDLLRVINNYKDYNTDDENIVLQRPNLNITGMLVRTNLMIELGDLIDKLMPGIKMINDSLDFRAPVDSVMWTYLQMYARFKNPDAAPIYMNKINYIVVNLDSVNYKYGKKLLPPGNVKEYYAAAINRYSKLLENLLKERQNSNEL